MPSRALAHDSRDAGFRFSAMMANIPQGQRLAIVAFESERRRGVAEVSVFERVE